MNNFLPTNLENLLQNEYVSTGIILLLVLYSALIAPKLPSTVAEIFRNPLFNLLIVTSIIYCYNKNVSISLVLLVGYIISLQTLKKIDASDIILKDISKISEEQTKKLVDSTVIDDQDFKPPSELLEKETNLMKNEISMPEEEMIEDVLEESNEIQEDIKAYDNYIEHPEVESNNLISKDNENTGISLDRGLQSLSEKTVTPMSRVLVEEELKQYQNIDNAQDSQIPTANSQNSYSNLGDDMSRCSILDNQIKESSSTKQSIVTSRSRRGLDINTKCNLCNNNSIEENNNIEIKAYSENTFSEI